MTIYFFSGLGADKRAFQKLVLSLKKSGLLEGEMLEQCKETADQLKNKIEPTNSYQRSKFINIQFLN